MGQGDWQALEAWLKLLFLYLSLHNHTHTHTRAQEKSCSFTLAAVAVENKHGQGPYPGENGARAGLAPETALTRDWQPGSRPHVVSVLQKVPLSLGFPERTICILLPSQDCLEAGREPSQKVSAIEAILGGHLINPPGFAFKETEAQKKRLGRGCRGQWPSQASVLKPYMVG